MEHEFGHFLNYRNGDTGQFWHAPIDETHNVMHENGMDSYKDIIYWRNLINYLNDPRGYIKSIPKVP